MPKRLALLLANGAYTIRAPLSRPVAVSTAMAKKLEVATEEWLSDVATAVDSFAEESSDRRFDDEPPLLLLCSFCGHGAAGCFFPVDSKRPCPQEESFSFFEDLLFPLLHVLGLAFEHGTPAWLLPGVRIFMIIESCRRLLKDEHEAYQATKTQVAQKKRHLLPCVQAMRPDLAFGNAMWDQQRLAFLSHLGRLGHGAPELLLALSSESTTASYDVVFLRSIVESIDKPLRLGGILERASLDTLRRTGHQQKPVILSFGPADAKQERRMKLEEYVLARPAPEAHAGRALLRGVSLPSLSKSAPMKRLSRQRSFVHLS
ncbi:unnamed protein product [Durusdinium trenchii]|uniref:Uncharacterized protein n=1 Tax=Durusdinium trenchii TaxID=1381693 RepID=A0ABP0SCF5_9DINO